MKSSVDEIRARFDKDVERFSSLETGQSTIGSDAAMVLSLIAKGVALANPHASHCLDLGCGAGNYALSVLQKLPAVAITLVDLSEPMLIRAEERVRSAANVPIRRIQGDIREIDLGEEQFDVIVTGGVLHHLRDDHEWKSVFARLFNSLKPEGSLWVADLISHEIPAVQKCQWQRYGEYLASLRDEAYRDAVFATIEREDSPRPLAWQLDLLRRTGFRMVDVLHKNICFGVYAAVK